MMGHCPHCTQVDSKCMQGAHLSLLCDSQHGFEPLALRKDKQCVKLHPHLETDTLFHFLYILQEFRLHFLPPPHSLLAGCRSAHSPRFWSQSIRGTSRLIAPADPLGAREGSLEKLQRLELLGTFSYLRGPEGSEINK